MTQLSLKAGMKSWKGKEQTGDKSDTNQMHFRDSLKSKHYRYLNEYQKKSILKYHMFLKKNRDSTIKGRTMAGRNKQRNFIYKEDSISLAVSTEAVIFSCIIDKKEKRYVAVIDIPNAFIQKRV